LTKIVKVLWYLYLIYYILYYTLLTGIYIVSEICILFMWMVYDISYYTFREIILWMTFRPFVLYVLRNINRSTGIRFRARRERLYEYLYRSVTSHWHHSDMTINNDDNIVYRQAFVFVLFLFLRTTAGGSNPAAFVIYYIIMWYYCKKVRAAVSPRQLATDVLVVVAVVSVRPPVVTNDSHKTSYGARGFYSYFFSLSDSLSLFLPFFIN